MYNFQRTINKSALTNQHKILAHLILISVLAPVFIKLCFTKIAAISISSGLVSLCFNRTKSSMFLSYLLVLLGTSLRMEVFFLILVLTFPIYLFFLFKKIYENLFHPSILIVLCLILSVFHYYSYRNSPEWKFYSKLNYLRAKITAYDNPNFQYNARVRYFNESNWNKIDYDFVSKFYFDLGIEKFNENKLEKLTSTVNSIPNKLNTKYFYQTLLKNFKKMVGFIRHDIFSLLVILCLLLLLLKKKWKESLIIAFFSIYCFFIINLFQIVLDGNYSKQRILWVIIYSIFGLIFYFTSIEKRYSKIRSIEFVLAFVCLVFIIRPTLFLSIPKNNSGYELQKIIEKKSDKLYISWPSMNNLNVFEVPIFYKNSYFLGWIQGSPHNIQKLSKLLNVNSKGIYDVRKSYDWYFLDNSEDLMTRDNIKLVMKFYKQNFKNAKLSLVKHSVNNKGVYWKLKIVF
jgi:hypothetical protein